MEPQTYMKRYLFRIYPDGEQQSLIGKTIGCCRFVFNHFLVLRQEAWEKEHTSVSYARTAGLLTQMKKQPETSWLKEADSVALQESLRNLDNAYRNFFDRRANYPKLKRKNRGRRSYRTRNQNNSVRIEGQRIFLPKLGGVRFRERKRRGKKSYGDIVRQNRILNATVLHSPSGRYYVSLCVEHDIESLLQRNEGKSVSLCLGAKEFCIDSRGNTVGYPSFFEKAAKQLAREQRKLSRQIQANIEGYEPAGKGMRPVWTRPLEECRNFQKQRKKVARIHEKIADRRKDFLHKLSAKVANENQVVTLRQPAIGEKKRNKNRSRIEQDAGWGMFRRMLEYKLFLRGGELHILPANETQSLPLEGAAVPRADG